MASFSPLPGLSWPYKVQIQAGLTEICPLHCPVGSLLAYVPHLNIGRHQVGNCQPNSCRIQSNALHGSANLKASGFGEGPICTPFYTLNTGMTWCKR